MNNIMKNQGSIDKEKKDLINEALVVIIASLFLGLILALKISWPKLIIETNDFIKYFLLSLLMLFVFVSAQKFIAFRLDCKIKTKLLTFRRYWFQSTSTSKGEFPFDFPLWFVLPLILVFLTIKWLAILDFNIEPKQLKVRRRWQELTENDVSMIAISGPIAVLILGLLSRIAGFNNFALICVLFSFLTLIPIGQGFKLLNSSRLLWMFSFLLSLFILLLMHLTGAFATLVIALILAAIITLAYYIVWER